MTYQKPNRKAEKQALKDADALRWRALKEAVVKLDKKCRNPWCQSGARLHDPHHIQTKRQGGEDRIENLIGLCRDCHNEVQGTTRAYYPHRRHPQRKKVAAQVLMDKILTYWLNLNNGVYRWEESHAYIRDVIERKGLR